MATKNKENKNIQEEEIEVKTEEKCSCCSDNECHCDESCDCGCQDEKEESESLLTQYLNIAKRVQADFDNYRRRTQEELKNARTEGAAFTISRFLSVVDAIKKSISMITDEKTLEGLNMIDKQIEETFKNMGVEKLEVKGKKFDPATANVIAVLNDNSLEDGVVIDEAQAGYKLNNIVVRYAQVVVNKIEK